jgi:hypothetical protein
MGRADLIQVAHAIELIELIGDPGEVSEIYIDGAGDMPAGAYQVTATTAATPVDVRIVYRD